MRGALSVERLVEEATSPRSIAAAVIMILVFTASMLLGYLDSGAVLHGRLGEALREEFRGVREAAGGSLLLAPLKIYLNNLRVTLIAAATSVLVVPPLILVSLNGLIVGVLLSGALGEIAADALAPGAGPGARALIYYAGLIPHGVLEIPTIAMVAGLALERWGGLRGLAGRAARRLLMAVVNLSVAAVVEIFVTIPVIVAAALLVRLA